MKTAKRKKVVDKDWILCPEIDFARHGIVGFHDELRARFLLNCIVYRRFAKDLTPIDWVYLPTDALEVFMGGGGSHIKKTRVALEETGLIECDHYAVKGSKVYGYRLGPALEGVKFAKWAIPNKTYVKRFRKFREWITRPKDLDQVGEHLMSHAKKLVKASDWDDVVKEVSKNKGGVEQVVDYYDNGHHNWSMCAMGRFHSIFTRMPCELRQSFASAEGDRLVEIDIVGSQMFYLLTLLENVIAHPEKYATPIVDQDIVEKRNRAKAMGEWSKYNKTYKASESRRTVEQGGIQDQEQAEGGQDQSGDPERRGGIHHSSEPKSPQAVYRLRPVCQRYPVWPDLRAMASPPWYRHPSTRPR